MLLFVFVNVYKVSELLCCIFVFRYNTFSGYPPEVVKKMPKKDLAEEVSLLLFCDSIIVYHIKVLFTMWLSTKATTFLLVHFQVWRLQAALGEQSEITKSTQQEYERLQNVLSLCLTCPGSFFVEIKVVWLLCRSFPVDKAKQIPFVSGEGTL